MIKRIKDMINNILKWIYKWSSKIAVIGAIGITITIIMWIFSNYGYGNGSFISVVFDWAVNVLGSGTVLLIIFGFIIGVYNIIKGD